MLFFTAAALASDHGLQRIYDREVACEAKVDPRPDPDTCTLEARALPPDDDHPSWAITVAPPGKLWVAFHMPAIDWGRVHSWRLQRSFDPIILTVGLADDPICRGERLQFAHSYSERGATTHQACVAPPWEGTSEVLLASHGDLPSDTWTPIWVHRPVDPDRAIDVKQWFIVQIYLSSDGTPPAAPPHHPYADVRELMARVPQQDPG